MGMMEKSPLASRLAGKIEGELLFDAFSRGRYATDASIYQMTPLGAVVPKSLDDIETALGAARELGASVLPRGGGTSQCGQTVNHSLVLDNSKYFNRILDLDVANRRCVVQPGIVLDELNRALKPHGLWFPVDVSTASRATIGGMAANNSCGGRSLRYGTMRDNVLSIEAILADGTRTTFGPVDRNGVLGNDPTSALISEMLALGAREQAEIAARFPNIIRRVGGYNIDALTPDHARNNMAHLLVGSEGTLGYFTAIELKLSPLQSTKVTGACHFPTFHAAMDAAQHLVPLKPAAVELVDDTMIALARDIPMFRQTISQFVQGDPAALLLVEFAEGSDAANAAKLEELSDKMAALGFGFDRSGKHWGGSVAVTDLKLQNDIGEVRKSGLNIMMSMKSEGKPVSFVEDCAVELPDLAAYTAGLTEIFEKHGTKGTWYAHASVGCLHVRPVLNMKLDKDVKTMRAIAEECFDLVAHYKGSHSGEHGDGIVRSEFHEKMFGPQMVASFNEVKDRFDPNRLFNPGKIVQPPKMDDRRLFRYGPDYTVKPMKTALDWSAWPGAGGGFQGAVEMCNNNGACRKLKGGVMCPSYRVTRNERDVVRGRANSLRLAISGQLGPDAFASDDMVSAMKLCVSCKGCKRECPTGVDMAKMKIEVLAARAEKHGLSFHDKLVGYMPAYAPFAAKLPWLANARNWLPGAAKLTERLTGFAASRKLPAWSNDPFLDTEFQDADPDVVLWADIFNRYFEPENLRAAGRVLRAAGLRVAVVRPADGKDPLDCGRTYLAVGLVEEARASARRALKALVPHAEKGVPIVGLEPSSLLTLRDEWPVLVPGPEADLVAQHALMLEEYLVRNEIALPLKPLGRPILLHGHCHQKAHNVMPDVQKTLAMIPQAEVSVVETSCCGMAGAFGYGKDTVETSLKMAELDLLPAVRAAAQDALVVADGTSCRHQIKDGAAREAIHVARILEMALDAGGKGA
ncbi:D-lactate dehydrogenase [Dinoroseobacter shibae DFL 12 = DSM 16493]|uniref:D-lactate dehydrogenase n=1 Tax=Dinoroseobacter shibae (strain DSM 16493 / NCIMB 14021 / DFL 12) TaxID=398580 RepID=A8LNG3_DINSH|nr:FAD-binding and (Fe-S)-binding domain-containing protein [Dinoroseobacter shibae]ABV95057.1 D-lactate dehydrogenase [Dinoroseobacter shibae DFL 12 = DSM 16493]URF46472.1 FAD-binding oxidoreductase [Dinoroseobacter shibae]URF50778.1 FAD-binding oxidoreductase [Dinoroseobacter shibae]